MRKLTLIAHTSLDGFVAGENGELDGFEAGEENLAFVVGLTNTADAALFGRVSYQLLEKYWPSAKDIPGATEGEVAYSTWYNEAEKIVVSRTLEGQMIENTTIVSENVVAQIAAIKGQAGKDILIFGSPSVAQLLMEENLIDDYWICINPVTFGKGIPLFTRSEELKKLQLISTRQFPNGELALHYIR
jgi:dihydrofolate reductase